MWKFLIWKSCSKIMPIFNTGRNVTTDKQYTGVHLAERFYDSSNDQKEQEGDSSWVQFITWSKCEVTNVWLS